MAVKSKPQRILIGRVDITPLLKKNASVPIDKELRAHFAETRKLLSKLERIRKELDDAMKDLESQDKMGNFEIQQLMSAFNQAETLASNVQKKADDTANAIIGKIG